MQLRLKKATDTIKRLTNGTYRHARDGIASRHSIVTRALYNRLRRLTKAAFDHCEAYSAEVETQVANGGGSSSQGASQGAAEAPRATPTKTRKPLKPKTPVKPKAASRRTPQPTEPAPPVVDLMGLVGTTVKQSFDGVWFDAKVSYVKPYFRLTFTDGDEQDMTSTDFKSLTEGVFEGARLRYHCGVPWVWADVIVQERYEGRRKHGAIWEADDQPYGSTARDAWVVEFANDGSWAPIDLRLTRKVADDTGSVPGTWVPMK